MIDLDAIKARAEAATEGPWSVRHEHYEAGPGPDDEEQDWYLIDDCYAVEQWANYDKETTEFIAHARTDVPALLAEVERLRDLLRTSEKRGIQMGSQIRQVLELAQYWSETGNGHHRDLIRALKKGN